MTPRVAAANRRDIMGKYRSSGPDVMTVWHEEARGMGRDTVDVRSRQQIMMDETQHELGWVHPSFPEPTP